MAINFEKITGDFEIIFKEALSDQIYLAIKEKNREFALVNAQRDLSPPKIVIGGGSAFNYYFKPDQLESFKTHDFDLRILYDKILPEKGTPAYEEFISSAVITRDNICDYFVRRLNYLINSRDIRDIFQALILSINNNPNIQFDFLQENESPFIQGSDQNLFYTPQVLRADHVKPVMFKYKMYGRVFSNAILDIIIYGRHFLHYGDPRLILDERVNMMDKKILYNDRQGFEAWIPHIITTQFDTLITEAYPEGELYYVSLGYLLWDTLRMLRWTAKRDGQSGKKYDRYLKKFIGILNALNKPDLGLNCNSEPFKRFRAVCLQEEFKEESKQGN